MGIDSMKDWLSECEYIADDALFNERDVWQHPVTFERLRRGDCEDFSLWTWRKLVESGFEAEFVAGWVVYPGDEFKGHTWVLFEDGGHAHVFDPVVNDLSRMVVPLEEVVEWYVPQVSVDGKLKQFVYGGYYNQLRPAWEEASR